MRANVIWILAGTLFFGYLSWRQWALGRELDALSSQLGAASEAQANASARDGATSRVPTVETHAERLRAIEVDLARARNSIRAVEAATGETPENLVSDQQILSVMKDHGSKVMEGQIKYHRERWLDQREVALNDFAKRYNLDSQQSDVLWGLLSSEIDQMIEILRNPDSFENPEDAALQWKRMLLNTDSGAHKVLPPQSAIAWDQTRFIERKILWPWLPD